MGAAFCGDSTVTTGATTDFGSTGCGDAPAEPIAALVDAPWALALELAPAVALAGETAAGAGPVVEDAEGVVEFATAVLPAGGATVPLTPLTAAVAFTVAAGIPAVAASNGAAGLAGGVVPSGGVAVSRFTGTAPLNAAPAQVASSEVGATPAASPAAANTGGETPVTSLAAAPGAAATPIGGTAAAADAEPPTAAEVKAVPCASALVAESDGA